MVVSLLSLWSHVGKASGYIANFLMLLIEGVESINMAKTDVGIHNRTMILF
jgi:hypothetical protein